VDILCNETQEMNPGQKRKVSDVEYSDHVIAKNYPIRDICDITDTEAAITAVIQSQTGDQICKGALIHQLYAILSNKTAVDSEISNLRKNGGVKLLQFDLTVSAILKESHFVMLSSDYKSDLENKLKSISPDSALYSCLQRFIPLANKYLNKLSIHESDLLVPCEDSAPLRTAENALTLDIPLAASDIQEIIKAGFLCKRTDNASGTSNTLWFSHPLLGRLRQWIYSSRKEITVMPI
jgi:Serine-threonine protein kinase 19